MPFRFWQIAGLAAGLLALGPPAAAQKYITAAGLRLGGTGSAGGYGLTLQQAVGRRFTVEGIAGLGAREISGTLLLEHHFGILGPSLNYYLGAGGHYGHNRDTGRFGGFDGIIGAEYKVAFLPLVLSFDVKPTIEVNGADYARFPSAFSVRFVLIKRRNNLFRQVWPFRK